MNRVAIDFIPQIRIAATRDSCGVINDLLGCGHLKTMLSIQMLLTMRSHWKVMFAESKLSIHCEIDVRGGPNLLEALRGTGITTIPRMLVISLSSRLYVYLFLAKKEVNV